MIFPENSDNVLSDLHEGFLTLTKFIDKRRGKPTKIYPMYENVRRKLIVIGKPFTLKELEGKSKEEILYYTADRINELNPYLEEDKENPLF